jgi:predicted Zn-dependent protease with MMP-like domain
MNLDVFADLVSRALDELPAEFRDRLENIQVDVEEWPTRDELLDLGLDPADRHGLLGLYHGVPLTDRSTHYVAFPDRITVYMRPVLSVAGSDEEAIARQVRRTVVHEIAHYYGIDDDRLEELGAY